MKRFLILLSAVAALSGPVHAASVIGTWKTEPDAKAQTGYVQIKPCGASFCGTVTQAFDKNGKPVVTASVGRQIIRGVRQTGPDIFGGGKVYVPIMSAEFPVEMTVNGNKLRLKACNGVGICRIQNWTRVR